MNVGQLKAFLNSFTDECEIYLEDGRRAKAIYKFVNGQGVLGFIPDEDTLRITWQKMGEDLED